MAGAIKGNGALKELWLQDNKIGDAGAAALADALRVNGALKELYLDSNQIGDAGAAALADALRVNGALIDLRLGDNQIGEDSKSKLQEVVQGRSRGRASSSLYSRDGGAYWSPPIARDGAR